MVAREYSPRCLPSGWSHLTGGRPVRVGSSVTSVYGGFGMRVWVQLQPVETPGAPGWMVSVQIQKANLTPDDVKLVMLGLFRNSKWARAVRELWHEKAWAWLEEGPQDWFSFGSNLIPLDFSKLPGVR